MKISFLVPAHNEEKIIGKTLSHLLELPYKDYEIIVGLDGCTDNTSDIVKNFSKKNKKIKYFSLDLRNGKPAVINYIIKKAKGDIIIINDADWVFSVKDKKSFKKFIDLFNDKKVGGIAESFPVEWDKKTLSEGNLWFKMVAYSTYYWILFQKNNFTYVEKNKRYLKTHKMFLTNIFRKGLHKENKSLGDDFERTYEIMKMGHRIVIFNDENIPRMKAIYNNINFKDLFKQKIRTAVARGQVKEIESTGLVNYYLPVVFFIIRESFKKNIALGFLMIFWVFITSLGQLLSKFSKYDTKSGWTLRAGR